MKALVMGLAVALLTAVAFVGGVVVGGHPVDTRITDFPEPVRGFLLGDSGESLADQVVDTLARNYYTGVDRAKLSELSVKSIVESLDDPYTYYLSPEDLTAYRASLDGSYFGVGLQVAQRDGMVVVTRVFEKGPAARKGVRAGDRIVEVDRDLVVGKALDVVVSRIKGPKGSTVELGLRRDKVKQIIRHVVTRERIRIPVVDHRIEARGKDKVGYVRLSQFTRTSGEAVAGAVRDLGAKGATSYVFDLRGNPGGLVDEAVAVSGVFLPRATPVVETRGLHRDREVLRTSTDGVTTRAPLAVLVDNGSASSSEIVAGALRDAGRAKLVGVRTFGKALVQSTENLRDGGALKLTTARYVTPDGFDLAKRGLPPDVTARDTPETPRDEALDRALAVASAAPAPAG